MLADDEDSARGEKKTMNKEKSRVGYLQLIEGVISRMATASAVQRFYRDGTCWCYCNSVQGYERICVGGYGSTHVRVFAHGSVLSRA